MSDKTNNIFSLLYELFSQLIVAKATCENAVHTLVGVTSAAANVCTVAAGDVFAFAVICYFCAAAIAAVVAVSVSLSLS